MKSIVLDEIPFALDIADLQGRLHLASNSESAREFRELAGEAQPLARPKAVFIECYVEHRGADSVTLGTVTLTSPA
ncbi:MAG: vitamin B12 dependent methionine synthase, partial [Chloroflexi bacterium]|nr:vitamin B12 dependent methionine synthase [Chloroflexota bacterium]